MLQIIVGVTPLLAGIWLLYHHDEETHVLALGIIASVILIACVLLLLDGAGRMLHP
jgi:hypothetical protein